MSLTVRVIAADKTVWDSAAEEVILPIALMGGFVEVENDEVVILVNGAERGDTIDREEARSTLSAAQARLDQSEQSEDKQERYEAQRDFKRARARLQASGEVVNI